MRTVARGTALLFLLATLPLVAQPSLQERITVNVVEVPVYVERNGSSVKGLTKDNFELFVNGAPRPIEYFDVIDEATVATEQASVRRRRLFVLLFDTTNSHPFALQIGKNGAKKFVTESAPGDVFAVATISRYGVRFVLPFTTDQAALKNAIDELAPIVALDPLGLVPDPKGKRVPAVMDGSIGSTVDVFGENPVIGAVIRGTVTGESYDPLDETVNSGAIANARRSTAESKKNEMRSTEEDERRLVANLAELADRLAPMPGVKHVVLLSGMTARRDQTDLFQNIDQMHQHYRRAGVILNAVDVGQDRSVPNLRATNRSTDVGPNPMFHALAIDTGGTVATSLTTLHNMQRVTYVLGFKPDSSGKKTNEIGVKLKGAPWGSQIRYRRGYSGAPVPRAGEKLLFADVVSNDIPQNGVTLDVVVTHGAKTQITAMMPGSELIAVSPGSPMLIDILLYIFDEKNAVAGWKYDRLALDLEKGRDFLLSNDYTYSKLFDLKPGKYSAKGLLRVVGSEVTGFDRTDFEVAAR